MCHVYQTEFNSSSIKEAMEIMVASKSGKESCWIFSY